MSSKLVTAKSKFFILCTHLSRYSLADSVCWIIELEAIIYFSPSNLLAKTLKAIENFI